MSCPRSTASMESAAICLRALGWPWVAACQAREDAAVKLRSPFQPVTRLWQFEVLIGVGPRRRSASEAIDLPSDGGVNLERLFIGQKRVTVAVASSRHNAVQRRPSAKSRAASTRKLATLLGRCALQPAPQQRGGANQRDYSCENTGQSHVIPLLIVRTLANTRAR